MSELDAIEVTKQLTKHREEIESLKHRMNSVESLTEAIHDMTASVQVLSLKTDTAGEKIEAMSKKVEALESKPNKKAEKLWDSAMATLINILLGAFIGALLSLILKGV